MTNSNFESREYTSRAQAIIKGVKKKNTKEEFMDTFDKLDPNMQEYVIRETEDYSNNYLIEYLPYEKYKSLYNNVANFELSEKGNLVWGQQRNFKYLVEGISEFYYDEAKDLLINIFEHGEEDACVAAAKGLTKSKQGLIVLENALQSNDSTKQVGAAEGIAQSVDEDAQPNLVKILKKYRTHDNYQVRIACIFGLFRSKKLSAKYLGPALQDENPNVRRRAMGLIWEIDENIAKDYVTLLEDRKGYIVTDVFEVIEKGRKKLDEEALSNAIISELIIRESGRPSEYFNTEIISHALQLLFQWNSRLYGETLNSLSNIAFTNKADIRRRAVLIATSLDERGFLAQVNEKSKDNPETAKEILNLVTGNLDANVIANQISGTDPSNVQQNAANQIKLLAQYHENGLQQAKTSFIWAIVISLAGFPFLISAIYFLLINETGNPTGVLSAVASVFVEFIAGTLFYLYNQTRKQLTYYHQQMNQTQRFLLANSVAESLEQPAKENARIELIKTIAKTETIDDLD